MRPADSNVLGLAGRDFRVGSGYLQGYKAET